VIVGNYDSVRGPLLLGKVTFPREVRRTLDVNFLLDTGSAFTCLMPSDLEQLSSADAESFRRVMKPSTGIVRGIGGVALREMVEASIAFLHEDQTVTVVRLNLSVIRDSRLIGLPSLLGRDILEIGGIEVYPVLDRVYLDLPLGEFVL
jgi:hypothetical protein